jgi:hypothetical protein
MKASDYVAQQLLGEHESYGSRFANQPRVAVSLRLPVELVAWIEILKAKGLGNSRNEVVRVLLDVAVEQVAQLGVCGDASDLSDMVDSLVEQMSLVVDEEKGE